MNFPLGASDMMMTEFTANIKAGHLYLQNESLYTLEPKIQSWWLALRLQAWRGANVEQS